MPFASFEVQVDVGPLGPSGVDQVAFFFSANAGDPPRPLHKVASGGEASRLLLAVKAALLDSDDDGVSVFDEADAGVGGAVADAVGLSAGAADDRERELARMLSGAQVSPEALGAARRLLKSARVARRPRRPDGAAAVQA
jgi:DNA repair protein RecN (Recombination protein N)